TVTVDGCSTSLASLRVRRRSVIVGARFSCPVVHGTLRLAGAIRGRLLAGTVTVGRRHGRFRARRVAPSGVLLAGHPAARALAAVRDTDRLVRHGADELSASGGGEVARTELELTIARGA